MHNTEKARCTTLDDEKYDLVCNEGGLDDEKYDVRCSDGTL